MPRHSLKQKMLLASLENLAALHSIRTNHRVFSDYVVLILRSSYGYDENISVALSAGPAAWLRDIEILIKKANP